MIAPRTLVSALTLVAAIANGGTVSGAALAADLSPGEGAAATRNESRAAEMLDDGTTPGEGIEVLAELILDMDSLDEGSTVSGRLAVQASELAMATDEGSWILSFVATQVDNPPIVRHVLLDWPTGAGGRGWHFTTNLLVTEELQDAAVVIEDLSTGRWGGTWVEFTGEAGRRPPGYVVLSERTTTEAGGSGTSTGASATGASAGQPTAVAGPAARQSVPDDDLVIRLVPPAGRPIVGRARFRTVVTTEAVEKAIFYLDGKEISVDERGPFSAVIDVGKEPTRHTIRVAAFGFRDLALGEDSIEINLDAQPFRVAIRALTESAPGKVRVAVDLSVPPAERLARLEFYRNTELAATATGPPWQAEIDAADGSGDFVRVLAVLVSGESLEDAQILAPGIISERVEVNLVEVYAVVTDKEGRPATNLTADQFRLKRGRREVPIDRFSLADEVPLVLGLIVDSSESMYPLMVETRRAAGQFFSSTLEEADRGFLVDFDTKPRMAQGLTGDLSVLLRGLGELRPGGATAIYDATVFSLAQFESEPGRRALVLLTDGRDYGSRFSTRRCVQEARRLGVPLYVIVLNNLGYLPNSWQPDKQQKPLPPDANLETLSMQTGGRLFNLAGTEDLADVYATINAELRSQYVLAFSTEERLDEKDLRSIEVEVEGKGLEVRTVTLNR